MRCVGPALLLTCLGGAAACGEEPPDDAPPTPLEERDWRDEVLYQILVDRFDDADRSNDAGVVPGDLAFHQGGDWAGIRRRLDYLQRLGVTSIWISPIQANGGVPPGEVSAPYHGYWITDYTRTNDRFGREEELAALVSECHQRRMRVIADVVPNHTARVFDYDLDRDGVLDPGESQPPYQAEPIEAPLRWNDPPPRLYGPPGPGGERVPWALGAEHFHRRGVFRGPDRTARERGDFPSGLRDLVTEDERVAEGLVQTHLEWIERLGLDGLRLDAVPHAPLDFWRRFAEGIRSGAAARGRRNLIFLGEVFDPRPEVLGAAAREGGLDASFDFSIYADLIGRVILEGEAPSVARGALETYAAHYPPDAWARRALFADNHDVPRIAGEIPGDPRVRMLAAVAVYTAGGFPVVYYGTEQALTGGFGHDARAPLWPTSFREDHPMFRHLAHLAELRQAHEALRRGETYVRYASVTGGLGRAADAGLLAWERVHGEARVLVVLNTHATDAAAATIPNGFGPDATVQDLLEGGAATNTPAGLAVRLPARSARIYAPADPRRT